jgi:UDP-N-acetylmuramoyl-tripeptide--D-alanyl-D-alanine ligase
MTGGRAWTSAEVAEALGVRASATLTFTGISTDTRHPVPGTLFVALKGERFDAHEFLAQAKTAGAAAAVVRRGTPPVDGLPYFEVDDTLAALGLLARARRRLLPAGSPVVAVTGSSGKTSTKEMIRAALATRWRVHATEGNLNNLIGVPLTILSAPEDTEALVVEAGASVPGEIARLRDIIEPTIAVITNVGYAHVEGFGSLEGVKREKLALLDGVPDAVVGPGPEGLLEGARKLTREVTHVEVGEDAILDACLDEDGHPRLPLEGGAGGAVTLPVLGIHQLENALIALAVAERLGIDHNAAVRALAEVRLPAGRGELRSVGWSGGGGRGLTVIDDTYNANPTSLRRAVQFAHWLARKKGRPLAVVVGTMLELGPESARLHAEAAREIVARRPGLVAAVGEFVPVFEALGQQIIAAPDAESLGPKLRAALKGNEIVLLKASRGVALERVLRHLS